MDNRNSTKEDLVKHYFLCGYSYKEISNSLHMLRNILLSVRQINRILRSLGLFRRHNYVTPETILLAISEEFKGSASCFGYRFNASDAQD